MTNPLQLWPGDNHRVWSGHCGTSLQQQGHEPAHEKHVQQAVRQVHVRESRVAEGGDHGLWQKAHVHL